MTSVFAPGRFDGALHRYWLRVYFEDTDLSGIVYHANYLRYMERARSDMLRLAGIDQRGAVEAGEGAYAVTDLSLRWRAPARLDDTLVVTSAVEAVRGASCVIVQTIRREGADGAGADGAEGTVLTEGRVTAAFLTPAGRPRRQPADWIARFTAIAEGRPPA